MKTAVISILASLLLLALPQLNAQATYPLKTITDSLPFHLAAHDRKLVFEWVNGEKPWINGRDFAVIQTIRLQDGDLMLEFIPPKDKPSLSYTFDFWILSPEGRLIRPRALRYLPGRQPGQAVQTVVWEDIAESLREAGAEYTLFIRRALMGAVNCLELRPEFTLSRQLPIWVAGSMGALMIGAGQIYNSQKKDLYASYQAVWRNEGDEPAAQNFLTSARQKEKTARSLSYAGWATLGISAVWYGWQRIRIRKKQKLFDTFCRADTPSLSLSPVFGEAPMFTASAGLAPALALHVSF